METGYEDRITVNLKSEETDHVQ